MRSIAPPGVAGTTIFTAREGYACAPAPWTINAASAASSRRVMAPIMARAAHSSICRGGGRLGDFLQLVISGTAVGAIYALAALGFTLLWQASGTINFAQGEFVMLPAFITLLGLSFGAPLWLAFAIACIASILVLGVGFKKAVVDPLIRHGVSPPGMPTLCLSIALEHHVMA